jgi:hypothetical protein
LAKITIHAPAPKIKYDKKEVNATKIQVGKLNILEHILSVFSYQKMSNCTVIFSQICLCLFGDTQCRLRYSQPHSRGRMDQARKLTLRRRRRRRRGGMVSMCRQHLNSQQVKL